MSIQKRYLITSSKRGVGKTCLAAHLAVKLSEKKVSVGLMDLDDDGTDISTLIGLKGSYETDEAGLILPQSYSDNLQVISIESMMGAPDETQAQGENKGVHAIRRLIPTVKWGPMDYLLVDAPPGTASDSAAVAQTIQGAKVLIVTTPERESLKEIDKIIEFYRTLEMPILGVIENRSGLFCEKCDRTGGTTLTESVILDIDYLGRVPNAVHMAECITAGESFLKKHPDSEAAHGYALIVDKLIQDRWQR